jgi:hypothetical protein
VLLGDLRSGVVAGEGRLAAAQVVGVRHCLLHVLVAARATATAAAVGGGWRISWCISWRIS